MIITNANQLAAREMLILYFSRYLKGSLRSVNNAFRLVQVETPVLIPVALASTGDDEVQLEVGDGYILRSSTTFSGYEASRDILSYKADTKQKLPFVLWQHGKVFGRDRTTITEATHLEFQILFSHTTGMNYSALVKVTCGLMLGKMCGVVQDFTHGQLSQATPYARLGSGKVLLAQLSERSDFPNGQNIELIIDLDACVVAHCK